MKTLFIILGLLSIFTTTTTTTAGPLHFFPNTSSVPPSLTPNVTAGAWERFQKLLGCKAGQKVDGLAKLKQYFRYFGYITNSTTNFTDEFDHALQAAIRTYQLNFNLNSTGELDDPTLKQLVRPRCGVADIINGTSSMNSGRAPSASSVHIHNVARYSFFPGQPRWPGSMTELTYAFLPENQLSDTVRAVFSRAFERWSEVTPLTFRETDSFFDADVRIGFFTGDHGDGEPFDGVLGTLAHSFSPPSGRLHMDGDENWVVEGDGSERPGTSAVDLESVAVHEIGHVLGLGHSSVEEAIMYPTISSGTRKVELASDDVQGIQQLYGSNPNYNWSEPLNPSGDNSGAHIVGPVFTLRFLLALGFILLLV